MKQSEIFLEGEGMAWLERNKAKLPVSNDPIVKAIEQSGIRPGNVLEVGAADGWRLQQIEDQWGVQALGIDPGSIQEGGRVERGTADNLSSFRDAEFSTVIYGFCLYLCDREDLFKIVAEGDRVLKDGGHLIVYDFYPRFPHSRSYSHKDGVKSYKMDYARLWLGNPAYTLFKRRLIDYDDEKLAVSILKKDLSSAWPFSD